MRKTSSNRHRLNVTLAERWREVRDEGPGRAYRRLGASSGWLRLSLFPPMPEIRGDGESIGRRLAELLKESGMAMGRCVHSSHGPCAEGVMATSLWKSLERGILQFWLVPSRATVFASYQMGSLKSVQQELADAQRIIETMHFERVEEDDGSDWIVPM